MILIGIEKAELHVTMAKKISTKVTSFQLAMTQLQRETMNTRIMEALGRLIAEGHQMEAENLYGVDDGGKCGGADDNANDGDDAAGL